MQRGTSSREEGPSHPQGLKRRVYVSKGLTCVLSRPCHQPEVRMSAKHKNCHCLGTGFKVSTDYTVYYSLRAAKRLALYKHKCDVRTPWVPTAPHSPLGSGAGHRGQKCLCDCPVTRGVMLSYCSLGRNRVQLDDSGGPGSVARGRDLR